jgi:hypothetical protein
MGLNRPYGTSRGSSWAPDPSDESLGYYQMSLRDKGVRRGWPRQSPGQSPAIAIGLLGGLSGWRSHKSSGDELANLLWLRHPDVFPNTLTRWHSRFRKNVWATRLRNNEPVVVLKHNLRRHDPEADGGFRPVGGGQGVQRGGGGGRLSRDTSDETSLAAGGYLLLLTYGAMPR